VPDRYILRPRAGAAAKAFNFDNINGVSLQFYTRAARPILNLRSSESSRPETGDVESERIDRRALLRGSAIIGAVSALMIPSRARAFEDEEVDCDGTSDGWVWDRRDRAWVLCESEAKKKNSTGILFFQPSPAPPSPAAPPAPAQSERNVLLDVSALSVVAVGAGVAYDRSTKAVETKDRQKELAEQRAREEAARLKAEQEAREAAARAKAEQEAREAAAKAQAEKEVRDKAEKEAAARAKAEQEAKDKAERDAAAKAEQEAREAAEREAAARTKVEQEAREKAARAKAEQEARENAEREAAARAKAEQEAREKAAKEAEARAKAEQEAREKAEREAAARAKAEQEAREKAEREAAARAKAEQEAREKAEREAAARAKAEQEAREKAAREAAARAEAEAVELKKRKTMRTRCDRAGGNPCHLISLCDAGLSPVIGYSVIRWRIARCTYVGTV
jgi:hypothetical protein